MKKIIATPENSQSEQIMRRITESDNRYTSTWTPEGICEITLAGNLDAGKVISMLNNRIAEANIDVTLEDLGDSPSEEEEKTEALFREGEKAERAGTCPDELNLALIFSGTHTQLLTKIASGEIDARYLAKRELAARGQDKEGLWVGFDRAEKIHGIIK